MKITSALICAGGLWAGAALAESPVTLTIDAQASGAAIPENFDGLSFRMSALPADKAGAHFFSATNAPLVTLFQNLGVTHLRVGGTSVELPPGPATPGDADIDSLFAFAKAAGVKKVIYSLRLRETNSALQYAATNAAIAKYIWSHYQPLVDCFAIGNEPDRKVSYKEDYAITNFPSYLAKWKQFAEAITNAVPEAKLAGPETGNGNGSWSTRFAKAEKNSGIIGAVTEHYYPVGNSEGAEAAQSIEAMLSPAWLKNSERLHKRVVMSVVNKSLPFRFTEVNDYFNNGVPGASDTFAGALWALDFLHWWSEHDVSGVDFHNTMQAPSDIIAPDADGRPTIKPKAYGLKAFELGSHGNNMPVDISNAEGVNLTAYAVRGGTNLFVTIINKEHGTGARAADVTIVSEGIEKKGSETISLTAPNGDVAAKTGVTLGGVAIGSDGPWLGKWTPLPSHKAGKCVVKVAAATAVVVKVALKQ